MALVKAIYRPTAALAAFALSAASIVLADLGARANGQPTYDVAYGALNFNKGAAPNADPVTQNNADDSYGIDAIEGAKLYYYDVFVSSGTSIGAVLTFTGEDRVGGSGGTDNDQVRVMDGDSSTPNRIQTSLGFADEESDEWAEFTIQFVTGLQKTDATSADWTPVTLENVVLNVYDIDSYQYLEVAGTHEHFFSSPTILRQEDGLLANSKRYVEYSGTSSSSSNMNSRVEIRFPSVSTLTYRLGQDVLDGDEGSAGYDLDFTQGVAWNGQVTFNSNFDEATTTSQTSAFSASLSANSFTRPGFAFAGWNTSADGTGTAYAEGAVYNFRSNLTLFAQWTATTAPAPAPYSGPIPIALTPGVKPAGDTMNTVLSGERLSGITGAEVDGKKITITRTSENSVGLNLPALAAGTYDVTYFFGNARVVHQAALVVRANAASSAPSKGPFTITQRFTGYRGDRGPVVARDLRAITAFIKANPGLTSVTCTGSTSGIPAKSTDQALATARATNACNIVKRLVPGITTSISTITGQGVGQFHRAVIITGQGTRP